MTRARYGTGSIRQTGPGRFQLRWSEGVDPFTGAHLRRTETVHVKTRTEANRILSARIAARGRSSAMTVGQLLDSTLPQLPIADSTRERYGYALAHVPPIAREWIAADVSVPMARTVIDGLTERHGPQTVRKAHGALMACWRQAALNGWVSSNPWRGQRLPAVPASAGQPLDDAQVARLLEACTEPIDACWIRVHLSSGARPGEVVGLRWSDIGDDAVLRIVDAKHGGTERFVAVDDGCLAVIRSWQNMQRQRALAAGVALDADPWLFANDPASSTPWRRHYSSSFRWKRLWTAAKLPEGVTPNDLRHTHNTWLAAANIDETTRGRRIGNTAAVNTRVYSHPTRDREAAEVVAQRFA